MDDPSAPDLATRDGATDARSTLEAERRRLQAVLSDGISAPGPMTYGSQAAAATQVFEQQRDLALRDRTSRALADVEAALRRLDEGTYGTCAGCGRPVGAERLAALPWAALCIDCQRAAGRTR